MDRNEDTWAVFRKKRDWVPEWLWTLACTPFLPIPPQWRLPLWSPFDVILTTKPKQGEDDG